MQHTLNSICMTGWVFSSQRSSLQSVPSGSCQGRGGISLSDADSSCPSAGWMEWKWHHVYSGKMFPGPDQCQQDAGTLEDGKHARDQSLDLLSWSTPHTTCPSSFLSSQRHCTPCPADPHHPMQTGLHTCHTPPHKNTHHTHLPLTHHPNTYQHTPQWQHTHMYHVFMDTQTPRGIHRCTWSLPISMQTTTPHIYFQVGAEQLGCRRSYRC